MIMNISLFLFYVYGCYCIVVLNRLIMPDSYKCLFDPLCVPNILFQLKYLYISEKKRNRIEIFSSKYCCTNVIHSFESKK